MDLARSREPAPSSVRFATAEGGREGARGWRTLEFASAAVAVGLSRRRTRSAAAAVPPCFLPPSLRHGERERERERKAHSTILAHGHACVVASAQSRGKEGSQPDAGEVMSSRASSLMLSRLGEPREMCNCISPGKMLLQETRPFSWPTWDPALQAAGGVGAF